MLAVKERDTDLVRALLETGQSGVIADATWADEFGVSCIHVACKLGDVAIIQLLVAYGADWQARDVDGATPLHYAAMCATDRGGGGGGGEETVRLLLQLGVDVKARDVDKRAARQVFPLKKNLEKKIEIFSKPKLSRQIASV
jgi:hypothetical protein